MELVVYRVRRFADYAGVCPRRTPETLATAARRDNPKGEGRRPTNRASRRPS